jgi:hypothetical protein
VESQKAIAGISAKVVTYFQTRSADQIGQDVMNALDAKWTIYSDSALNYMCHQFAFELVCI